MLVDYVQAEVLKGDVEPEHGSVAGTNLELA